VRTIVDFLDLTLLKKPIYVNIVLGITFALYSDITFFTMQPVYLFELGYSRVSNKTRLIDWEFKVFANYKSIINTINMYLRDKEC